jgi:tetratricopeptide (TPR) repeat protein
MGRPERVLDISHPLHAFAAELRGLRQRAGSPKYLSMSRRTGVSRTALSEAAGGDHLPTWRTVEAYVLACGGDPADLLPRWERLSDRHVVASDPPAATPDATAVAKRSLPRDILSFTGREEQLRQLLAAVSETARRGRAVGISAIDGMAGVGKTAFAVHAAHRLAPEFPDGQLFLDLHAHTADQGPVIPADALRSLLLTMGLTATAIPADLDARAALWRDRLAGRRMLVVLDDAAGHEQVRPLLPGTPGSLVLITSRRRLAALEEVEPLTLGTLPPGQAGQLFNRLTAAGPSVDRAAVAELMELCGCLPLAIGLVAGRLRSRPSWSVRDLADRLRDTQDRLSEMRAENLAVGAAFELSYRDLPAPQQRLFRRLGLHPGRETDAHAAAALDGTEVAKASALLDALYDDHLIDEPLPGRYRLHDLIREYARSLAQPEDDAALDRVLGYYLQATVIADGLVTSRAAPAGDRGHSPADPPELSSRPAALAWLETERANLGACLDHAAARGKDGYVAHLAHSLHSYLRIAGHWDQALTIHQVAMEGARRAGDRHGEGNALADLGIVQQITGAYPSAQASLTGSVTLLAALDDRHGEAGALSHLGAVHGMLGEYGTAIDVLTRALTLFQALDDRRGQAEALTEMGVVQYLVDEYRDASASLSDALTLLRDAGHPVGEANALTVLGIVRYLSGDYPGATACLTDALGRYRGLGDRLGVAETLCELGRLQELAGDYPGAIGSLAEALALFRAIGSPAGCAITLIRLGVVQWRIGRNEIATASVSEALDLYRGLGLRLGQANALSRLGGLQYLAGHHETGRASLVESLSLYRELGDKLGQAYALNTLGARTRETGHDPDALASHLEALLLARDVGSPLEEARALEGIGRCRRHGPDPEDGRAHLRQALEIYRRLGSPEAAQVVAILT